jgi:hypothetical protein
MEDFALQEVKQNLKVHQDYHIQFRKHFYSVPFTLVTELVDVHFDGSTVQIYKDGERVACHKLGQSDFWYTTLLVHMPPHHQFWRGLTPEKLVHRAIQIGKSMTTLIETVLDGKRHPEQGYRAALGILNLISKYDKERLENAAARALHFGSRRRRDIVSILEAGLDRVPLSDLVPVSSNNAQVKDTGLPPLEHSNIRGGMAFKLKP